MIIRHISFDELEAYEKQGWKHTNRLSMNNGTVEMEKDDEHD